MSLLSAEQKEQVKARLAKNLLNPVTLTVFTQEFECDYCKENRELAEDIASSSDKIKLEIFDLMSDKEIYDLIDKGKGKMIGEEGRLKPEQVWNVVNYVRSLSKKS